MKSNPISLVIDVGKLHSVFFWYDTASKQAEFRKVGTIPESFREILLGKPCDRVGVEAWRKAGWVSIAAGNSLDPQECKGTDTGKEIPQRPEAPTS